MATAQVLADLAANAVYSSLTVALIFVAVGSSWETMKQRMRTVPVRIRRGLRAEAQVLPGSNPERD
jgi:hypothetical protein